MHNGIQTINPRQKYGNQKEEVQSSTTDQFQSQETALPQRPQKSSQHLLLLCKPEKKSNNNNFIFRIGELFEKADATM